MHLPIIRSLLAPKPRFEDAKENKTISYAGLPYMKIPLIAPPIAVDRHPSARCFVQAGGGAMRWVIEPVRH